jgi:hypothetical protein
VLDAALLELVTIQHEPKHAICNPSRDKPTIKFPPCCSHQSFHPACGVRRANSSRLVGLHSAARSATISHTAH